MKTINATVTRSGEWWAVEFTSIAGERYTQAKRLDQVAAMVSDICELDGVEVDLITVTAVTSDDIRTAIDEYHEASQAAQQAAARASEASRRAARLLADAGLSMRDVGKLMGISHQRASQLVNSR